MILKKLVFIYLYLVRKLYWLCITNRENWEIIKKQHVWGVSERHKNTIMKVKKGDKLVFYVKQEVQGKEKYPSMIVGIYEVASEPYRDETEIFKGGTYPWRINIKPIKLGQLEFKPLVLKLKFIKNKEVWSGHLVGKAMREIPKEDYELIYDLLG